MTDLIFRGTNLIDFDFGISFGFLEIISYSMMPTRAIVVKWLNSIKK